MGRAAASGPPGLFDGEASQREPARSSARSESRYARVALDRPFRDELTWRVPEGMGLGAGMRVLAPLGRERVVGVVVSVSASPGCDPAKVRSLLARLDDEPLLTADLLELSDRIAAHYACSRGQVLSAMLPALLRKERPRRTETIVVARDSDADRLAELEHQSPDRRRTMRVLLGAGGEVPLSDLLRATKLSSSPVKTLEKHGFVTLVRRPIAPDTLADAPAVARSTPHTLTPAQRAAVDAIARPAVERRFEPILLFGVTGSGKTEVYLQALHRVLEAGRSALVLVPEISLTPQTLERFRARFGEVSVLHSHLGDSDRAAQWRRIRSGGSRIVVGARSAVFAPLADLGLVIVDEEHEPSFKQASVPRYHARDVALVRGQLARAAVVLGSATPSLESWSRAQAGRMQLVRLPERVAGGVLPEVRIADLRKERAREMRLGAAVPITRVLRDEVRKALERKERVILFLNRRGFAPAFWCPSCSATLRCERCSASMAYHRRIGRLVCHLCHRERTRPTECPSCGVEGLKLVGAGTERIEQVVLRAFPTAHVARMDSDTTVARGSHEEILSRFRSGEVDLLVGTQMIAKGLDVPEVTVVGVVDADATLHVPEFQSSERAFQLVAQVAGRAGRSERPGIVIVQTSLPDHPAIHCAARHDFETFAKGELADRRRFRYPPYVRLVRILVEARNDEAARRAIESAAQPFRDRPRKGIECLGPQPAPIETVKGRTRWHFFLRCNPPEAIRSIREDLRDLAARSLPGGVRAAVDVDPLSTL